MTQTLDLTTDLRALLERDPDLTDKLQQQSDAAQVSAVIMDSAQRHGVTLDVAALEQQVALAVRQAEMFSQVKVLMEADPALEPALRQATQLEAAVDLIMASAQRHGVELNVDELLAHLQHFPIPGDLSDEELEGVTGGVAGAVVALFAVGAVMSGLGAGAAVLGVLLGYTTSK